MFPNGKYNDQVDSMSQALHWMQNRKGSGTPEEWKEHFEAMDERARLRPLLTVSIRHADPDARPRPDSGRRIDPRDDGSFLITEEEWDSLPDQGDWEDDWA